MLLYDKGYSYIKTEYIVPLSQHSINYRSLGTTNIKTVLCNGLFTTATNVGTKHYKLTFDEDVILPALLGDLWLCYIRMCLQKDATQKIYPLYPDYCPNWSIVSDYYFSFYCACTLLRLTMRGTIYFDSSVIKEVNKNISAALGSVYSVGENSIFEISKDMTQEGFYIMDLRPSPHKTHETVWHQSANIIKLLEDNSSPRSDEYTFIKSLRSVLSSLQNNFPSKLRNAVNYQLPYGIQAIEKKIYPAFACRYSSSEKWVETILTFDSKDKSYQKDINIQTRLFNSYIKYLDILVNNLVYEYYDIQGKQCGVQKAINKHRSTPIIFPEAVYTYH